jgi:hypothetical protein
MFARRGFCLLAEDLSVQAGSLRKLEDLKSIG